MEARLPADKQARALSLVRTYLKRKSLTLLELQSVIGFLSFAAKVVPLDRPFLRRLYNALAFLQATGHLQAAIPPDHLFHACRPSLVACIPTAVGWYHSYPPLPPDILGLDRRLRH
jgi:hypothetical protein